MLKSIGKQVVILKYPENNFFDEVIFILKDGTKHTQKDLLEECERIINEKSRKLKKTKNSKKKAILISVICTIIISIVSIILYSNLL